MQKVSNRSKSQSAKTATDRTESDEVKFIESNGNSSNRVLDSKGTADIDNIDIVINKESDNPIDELTQIEPMIQHRL